MLLALVGVTGVGKTYFKDKIVEEFGFKKINTIRTRKIRQGEKAGQVGLFMTSDELDDLEKQGKLAYRFSVFGGEYAYLKDEVFSKENYVFEMHYTTIYDWKKIRPDIKTIYILPKSLELAKIQTKKRNLSAEKEQERLNEIDEHYNNFTKDVDLQKQFDYIVYNNYDEESKEKILDLVKKLLKEDN
jgi:guanylate kinase